MSESSIFDNTGLTSNSRDCDFPTHSDECGLMCCAGVDVCASTCCGSPRSCESLDEVEDVRTTVILKNLPPGCSRTNLLHVLDTEGFEGQYDFLYLPSNMTRGGSYCYAFVNMISHESAALLLDLLSGYAEWGNLGTPSMQIFWSDIQGRDTYVEKYRNSPVMHPDVSDICKPAVFENGCQVPFPPPLKAIKAPRLRDRTV